MPTASGNAAVRLRRPRNARALLVLTHGAGGTPDTADVQAAAAAAEQAVAAVALVTQPYRVAGRRTPPVPATQDVAWCEVIASLRRRRGLGAVPLVLGGRSNGARVAARTAAECTASGVLALAFPLHPPGRPERSRLSELDSVAAPVLVVQGARDPFGIPPAGPNRTVLVLPGDAHALTRDPTAVRAAVGDFLASLLG